MANETISTDKNWTALAARSENDILTIDSGATLTIDQTVFGAGNEGDLAKGIAIVCISSFSKLVMRNTDTAKAMTLMGAMTKTFRFESGCALDVDGGYISIYTGDGTA